MCGLSNQIEVAGLFNVCRSAVGYAWPPLIRSHLAFIKTTLVPGRHAAISLSCNFFHRNRCEYPGGWKWNDETWPGLVQIAQTARSNSSFENPSHLCNLKHKHRRNSELCLRSHTCFVSIPSSLRKWGISHEVLTHSQVPSIPVCDMVWTVCQHEVHSSVSICPDSRESLRTSQTCSQKHLQRIS